MATRERATIEDLYHIKGKAEIINGEVVILSPTGGMPSYAAGEIFASLREYSKRTRSGRAVPDNAVFHVHLQRRESFTPNVAYFVGPDPGMKFYEGAPVFAVEVRNENDYGPKAEKEIAAKRADYFAAGAAVVWDVNLLGNDVVKAYTFDQPHDPKVFPRGDIADAEPAVPGWSMLVNDLFAAT